MGDTGQHVPGLRAGDQRHPDQPEGLDRRRGADPGSRWACRSWTRCWRSAGARSGAAAVPGRQGAHSPSLMAWGSPIGRPCWCSTVASCWAAVALVLTYANSSGTRRPCCSRCSPAWSSFFCVRLGYIRFELNHFLVRPAAPTARSASAVRPFGRRLRQAREPPTRSGRSCVRRPRRSRRAQRLSSRTSGGCAERRRRTPTAGASLRAGAVDHADGAASGAASALPGGQVATRAPRARVDTTRARDRS